MILRQLGRRQAQSIFRPSRFSIQSRFLSKETEPASGSVAPPDLSAIETNNAPSELSTPNPPPPVTGTKKTVKKGRRQPPPFSSYGSRIVNEYEPEALLSSPIHPSDVTLELLLASQAHLGHATSLWNPRNSSYIFGIREGVHIISLEVIATHLRRAAKVVEEVAMKGGIILFVGTRKGQQRCVVRAAKLAQGYHVFERWIPGSLTNGQQILDGCDVKVVDAMDKEIPELRKHLDDTAVLKPDLVICLNPLENEPLLKECAELVIPTIGIIDTDADSSCVTYPIPANDDSSRCVTLIAGALGKAAQVGQTKRLKQSESGELPYTPISLAKIIGAEDK